MQIKPLNNFIIFDESVDIKQYLKIELACNRPFQNILFKIRKFHILFKTRYNFGV